MRYPGAVVLATSVIFSDAARQGKFSRHYELDNYSFEDFLRESGKSYTDATERQRRFDIFSANLKKIKSHNSNPSSTWKMGVNRFTDLSAEELKSTHGGDKRALHANLKQPVSVMERLKGSELPVSKDWRDVPNIVSAVKDQGHCGSCEHKICFLHLHQKLTYLLRLGICRS